MAVRKKGRRKIACGGRNYVWYVDIDYDSPLYLLHILSEDKKIILIYPIGGNYIVSQGRIFQGVEYSYWRRFLLPFDSTECITPGFVAKIIDWANSEPIAVPLYSRNEIIYTNCRGYAFDQEGNRVYTFIC